VQNSRIKNSEDIQISAWKYSILDMNEKEEGEIIDEEEDMCDGKDRLEVSENDLLEDEIFDQQEKEKIKSGMKKGRGRKARVHAVNTVKSIRSFRRNN